MRSYTIRILLAVFLVITGAVVLLQELYRRLRYKAYIDTYREVMDDMADSVEAEVRRRGMLSKEDIERHDKEEG